MFHDLRRVTRPAILTTVCLFATLASVANAQDPLAPAGATSYVPFGSGGGFVPYRSGTTGGLGVLNAPRSIVPDRRGIGTFGAMSGAPMSLRGTLPTLRPFGLGRGGSGMLGTGGMLPSVGRGAVMRRMPRPPVGSYPFRVPPSLLGPAPAPGMSM